MMFTDEFTPAIIEKALGAEWKNDASVAEFTKRCPQNLEYANRPYFFKLKTNEIKNYYPEYIRCGPKKVVDISAGNGILLEIMRLIGHDVVGLDQPDCTFSILARSQHLHIIEHNCNFMPLPLPSKSYDLLVNVGAIHHYKAPWEDVLKEFFRIAREAVFISVSKGSVFTEKRHILDAHEQKGWKKIVPVPDGMYKWVRDLK